MSTNLGAIQFHKFSVSFEGLEPSSIDHVQGFMNLTNSTGCGCNLEKSS